MEEVQSGQTGGVKPKSGKRNIIRNCFILILALLFGYLHYRYVDQLHENEFHFSHMSELERELALSSELGFYYSYYKTVVQERPFIAGITKLMHDRLVEYPTVVNAFSRFNIHPEVILGATYRYFKELPHSSRVCHRVYRGQNLPPVESCIGVGEPMVFYLQAIWVLAGFLVAVLFMFATDLSGSLLAGIVAVAQYFATHAESTRVQWVPNERENFAAPLLFLQMYLITLQLRENKKSKTSFRLQVSIFILNCLCLLFWQFSQFIFLTQTAIFFVMEQLKVIDLKTFCVFLHSHFCGLHMAVLLLQGNDLLKTSLYTSFFIVVSVYCLFFSTLRIKVQTKLDLLGESWLILLRICIVIISSIHVKKILNEFFDVQEDDHIWDLLYSKFTDFKTFHTLLYTCSEAFDFLTPTYLFNMSSTALLPLTALAITRVVTFWIFNGIKAAYVSKSTKQVNKSKKRTKDRKDYKMAANNKMADCRNGAKNSDTDDSGIENSECLILSKNYLAEFYCDQLSEKPELPVVRFVYFLKSMNIEPEIFYNVSQLVVFGVMAWLFMRLKLLLSTQLCIVSALAWNFKYDIGFPAVYRKLRQAILLLSCICLCVQGFFNVSRELANMREFSDGPGEDLVQWINRNTPPNAVFAAPLPISATIMLTTRRPIVTHPHYEHKENRERAYAVYKMFGRFSPHELYQELTKLQVTHLVFDKKHCYHKKSSTSEKKHCGSFLDMWDAEMPTYAGRAVLCRTLLESDTDHFYKAYSNERFAVFTVHDLSVQYMPRVFDT